MKKIRIPVDQNNLCRLPSKCVCCGDSEELQETTSVLKASTPLQLLAVVPWFVVGSSLKTEGSAFFIALFMSIVIYSVLSISLRVNVQRCHKCVVRHRSRRSIAATFFFFGLCATLVSGFVPSYPILLPVGFVMMFGALLSMGVFSRSFSVRLSKLEGSEAVLLVPHDITEA